MTDRLTIWLLNPYATGSHGAWARGYAANSRHTVRILAMQGYFWKWRMHGGAIELAEQARQLLAQGERPDVLCATSMTNVPTFLALVRRELGSVPVLLYMHENQLTYPPPPNTKRDLTYGAIQHLSMLAADAVRFNSAYHLRAWFDELPRLLKHFPDYNELPSVDLLQVRSMTLPLGLDLEPLDAYRLRGERKGPACILWNHRWEYDKAPELFLQALYRLQERGYDFTLALLGEAFVSIPPEFTEAQARLGKRIVQFGYLDARADYARWLWQSDIVVSTALHDFFGAAIVEALYCGCLPVLPDRLSYPQFIPAEMAGRCLYDSPEGLVDLLAAAIDNLAQTRATSLREVAAQYDWSIMAPRYDAVFEALLAREA